MKISRRKFISAAPIVAGAVLGLQNAAFGQKSGTPGIMPPEQPPIGTDQLSRLSWSSFYPYQNTDFSFRSLGLGKEATLTLVEMLDTKPKNLERIRVKSGECFTLTFKGSSREPLSQGTYEVNHFILGDFPLFITEGKRVGRTNYYVAVINRVVS